MDKKRPASSTQKQAMNDTSLKEKLNLLAERYSDGFLDTDPIQIPHQYSSPPDIEIAAFIAAIFSYGRVDLFLPKIRQIMDALGKSPANGVLKKTWQNGPALEKIKAFYYRFQKTSDLQALLQALSGVLGEHGSLKNFFLKNYKPADETVLPALSEFSRQLRQRLPAASNGNGISHLIPAPGKGAMKRLNMFLRWMVRKDRVDFGLWKEVAPSKLIIPLDTHIRKMAAHLGLCSKPGSGIKTALEITSRLKELCPSDPVKYDFALTRIGMFQCHSQSAPDCESCLLAGHCLAQKK